MSYFNNQKNSNILDDIESVMPQALKDAIKNENKDDPHHHLLEQRGIFAKLWGGMNAQDKQHYYQSAGMDTAAQNDMTQKITDLYKKAETDPKYKFNDEAADDDHEALQHPIEYDDDGTPFDVAVTGNIDPAEETEEEAENRRKRYQKALQELAEEEEKKKDTAAQNSESQDKSLESAQDDHSTNPLTNKEFTANHLGRYGIRDAGSYLVLRGKGARAQGGARQIEDIQLKMALLDAILDKKMESLLFIKAGRLDSQLASRAQTMLGTDVFLQKVLGDKANIKIHMSLPQDPPAYCKSALSKWLYHRQYKAQIKRGERADKEALKEGLKMSRNFTNDGKTLRESLKENAKKSGEPIVPPNKLSAAVTDLFTKKEPDYLSNQTSAAAKQHSESPSEINQKDSSPGQMP